MLWQYRDAGDPLPIFCTRFLHTNNTNYNFHTITAITGGKCKRGGLGIRMEMREGRGDKLHSLTQDIVKTRVTTSMKRSSTKYKLGIRDIRYGRTYRPKKTSFFNNEDYL